MSIKIEFRFKPVFELITSLLVFSDGALLKKSEAGPAWGRRVKKQLPPGFAAPLKSKTVRKELALLETVWVLLQDPPLNTPGEFAVWLKSLPVARLLESTGLPPSLLDRLLPSMQNFPLLCDLLEEWEHGYFSKIEPAILLGLERDFQEKKALLDRMEPGDLVELATGGLVLEEPSRQRQVVLVPQFHGRPINIFNHYRELMVILYPVDALPPAAGEPPPGLTRLTAALADQSRLKMLKLLGRSGTKSFGEIVSGSGLAKSTVHHHLIALRAAGLVRVHYYDENNVRYSLRAGALRRVGEELGAFLDL